MGDMLKSVYDKNNDGIVDNASAIGGKPDTEVAFLKLEATGTIPPLPTIDANLLNGHPDSYFATATSVTDINTRLNVKSFTYVDFKDLAIAEGEYTVNSSTILNPPYAGIVKGRISTKRYSDILWMEFRPSNSTDIYIMNYSTAGGWIGWYNATSIIDTKLNK